MKDLYMSVWQQVFARVWERERPNGVVTQTMAAAHEAHEAARVAVEEFSEEKMEAAMRAHRLRG